MFLIQLLDWLAFYYPCFPEMTITLMFRPRLDWADGMLGFSAWVELLSVVGRYTRYLRS
jgi:hypothetical protein